MSRKPKIGIILLGFGGPQPGCCGRRETCSQEPGCEAECFVMKVLGDDPEKADRAAEVAAHYHHLGGFSDYNPLTFQQRDALDLELQRRGIEAVVTCGFRNWSPWYTDGLIELEEAGCDVVVPVVMTAQSSEGYYRGMQAAAKKLAGRLTYKFLPCAETVAGTDGWIAANAQRIEDVMHDWSPERRAGARLLLTAHAAAGD